LKYGTAVTINAKTADGKWYHTADGDFISASLLTDRKPAETTAAVTTKAPTTTKSPATTTAKKMSARDLDTHGAKNIDVSAVLEQPFPDIETAQLFIDNAIEKYGKDVIMRHKRKDGIVDPTLDIGFMFADPDGITSSYDPSKYKR
jgi:hypothetical protein